MQAGIEGYLGRAAGGTCFDFCPADPRTYLVGTGRAARSAGRASLARGCVLLCRGEFAMPATPEMAPFRHVSVPQVGTEEGGVHRCSTAFTEQYMQSYGGHLGPVYQARTAAKECAWLAE